MSKLEEAKSRIVDATVLLAGVYGIPVSFGVQVQQGDLFEQQAQHAEAVAEFLEGIVFESIKKGLYEKFMGLSSLQIVRGYDAEGLVEEFGLTKSEANNVVKALLTNPIMIDEIPSEYPMEVEEAEEPEDAS